MSCYYRSQREGIYQAKSEASLEAEKIKSISYSRFLDRFADEVNNLNQKLLKTVQFLPNLMQKPSESYLKIVRLLKQSAEEFSDYLKAMKQISAIEGTKKYRIHREEFLIKPLIEKSLAQFSSRIEEMKLSIVWNIPDQYKMISDEKLLEPIIFNLLSNAIKYSHKSGKIFITITLLNKKTLLSIKDEGPGVDPKFHQLIFEKFYRIKDETNIKIKGTGLGLYLCKFFIKKLGGEIFINPEVTEGAEFQILI